MEDLIINQNQIMGAMEQLLRNFKKDGAERKTPPHIKKRLSTLEAYWQEFQCNHIKICEYDDKHNEYFINNYYKKTSEFYNESRTFFLNYLPSESQEKSIIRPATPGFLAQPSTSNQQHTIGQPQPSPMSESFNQDPPEQKTLRTQGTTSKMDEMLRRQSSNFKAFSRTISGIQLESLAEKWEFEDTLKSVQARWSVIDSLHWEIDSEMYEENKSYEDAFIRYEQKYINIKKEINSKMWSECHRQRATPQVDVPVFRGNYHSWVSFKDLYTETIHNNRSLSSAQKMQYLKSRVRDEPEKLIQHLHITTENYQVAWDILNQRYNNIKLIFNSHMNIIMSLPTMQVQSAANIKKVHDTTNECLNAIKGLGVDISNWDPLVVYLISQKLDPETHNDYIESLKNPRELPCLQEFLNFLEAKFTALESSKRKAETSKFGSSSQQYHHQPNRPMMTSSFPKGSNFPKSFKSNQNYSNKTYNNNHKIFSPTVPKCLVCEKEHGIFNCKMFLEFRPEVKKQTVENLSLCKNCLYDHRGKECFSTKRCRLCKEPHNTILHDAFITTRNNIPSTSNKCTMESKNSMSVLHKDTQEVLLATALIKVQAADGTDHIMRALIDQGSQTSLITENAAQLLGLRRKRYKGVILGVGAKENSCKGVMNVIIKSIYNEFSLDVDVFIMNHAVNNLPNKSFAKPCWPYIENIQLADPEFYRSRPVDLLLGADVYPSIIMSGIINLEQSTPIAQQTRLGWILCGNVKSYQCNVIMLNMDDISSFWAIEDINDKNDLSQEDNQCMELYQSTTTRRPDGRYVVRLPMHPETDSSIGLSRSKALAQFYQMEKKFRKNEQLSADYKAFIAEYSYLGHMHQAVCRQTSDYYMPHHCVQRAESTTTSLRVVFNASQPTSNGLSLNDLMYRGPTLQQDLMLLVTRWRQYKYAITSDIEKFFRQILINEDDQKYQKIIWRASEDQPLREYQLVTVTYGTKAAPFLAMRTLKQLASDEGHRFPEAAKAVEEQFYCDDLLTGAYSIPLAKQLQSDLIALLKLGGFNLRKWSSNSTALLQDVSTVPSKGFDFKHKESTKTLGLAWNSKEDVFTFQCKMSKQASSITKRTLLGEISKIFDPLGWLSPVVVQLKLLFQKVGLIELGWEDQIPEDIYLEWNQLRSDIENIDKIKIVRWLQCDKDDCIQLHGFCDASNKAYACVIYARIKNQQSASVVLVAAKTKLVPTNKQGKSAKIEVSLPRLELCGAQLLSKLMQKMINSLHEHKIEIYGWCDSTAVLGWLNGNPNRWKPFVANRVKQTTAIMPPKCWRYIRTQENPADCASRGMRVEQLQHHTLWWTGPKWLEAFETQDSVPNIIHTTDLETKKFQSNTIQTNKQQDNDNILSLLISKYSSFTRLTRVLAWIMRAISKRDPKEFYLTTRELELARTKIIAHIQNSEFAEDINHLRKHQKLHSNSKLLCLNPFLDSDGILRVGGRLKQSNISYDMKHPRIIPAKNAVTTLLIDHAHQQTLHGGTRLTHSWLRQNYWILSGNRTIKSRLRQCVVCRRHNPSKHQQLMGDLPHCRTIPSRPFLHTGVDYTGSIIYKSSKGRGIKSSKGYVAVFVCMVTKAVHLELVSDLTSSSFLAALRRLAAKRGTPRHIYSDNGTNFVKAHRILTQEYIDMISVFTKEFFTEISQMQITWHFNAPSWPSAGGLWEAAVKSLKYHLCRVIGAQKLTYEEFYTLLSQIEACLNSRPLCALTEDPDDINYLTPSHFLSSEPNLTIYETEKDERTRWHLTQKIFSDIWRRWRTEYLVQLSARSKWQQPNPNIKLNDVVIIHDVNLPAGKWALGRVVDLHPGTDGRVRVVSVKTSNGILKRPIIKLSLLPTNSEESAQGKAESLEENKPNKKKITKKGIHLSLISIIMFLMVLLTSTIQCASYNMSKLQGKKGIYFDEVTSMKLIQNDWKIIIYYDMDPYRQATQLLNMHIVHLTELCSKSKRRSHCDIILLQLNHGFSEVEFYDRMLLNQHFSDRTRRRVRRGLVNGVGYIANSLFGVLDERFAEQYERDIALVRQNQNHLVHLFKNQTSILEAENSLLKRGEDTMMKQHKIYNQHLMSLDQATNIIKENMEEIEDSNEFILSTITANNILSNLKDIQDMLMNTITSAKHLNTHLLTPAQLQNELSSISAQLPKELSLPLDNVKDELPKIYKILKVNARMTNQYFIFEIKLPLVNRDIYHIYRLIPIRHQVANSMMQLKPIAQYVAMNIKSDTFLSIEETDFYQKCYEFDSSTYLCQLQKPIYQRLSDEMFCVKNKGTCAVITGPCETQWTELLQPNIFLLTCCNQCTLRFICGNQVSTEQLTGVNIISMEATCTIKGEYLTINSHKERENVIHTESRVFAPEVIAPINHIIKLSIPINTSEEMRTQENSLQDESKRIQQIKEETENIEEQLQPVSHHDIHQYTVMYTLVCAGLAAMLVAGLRACRRRRALAVAAPPRGEAAVQFQSSTAAQHRSESAVIKAEQSEVKQHVNRATSPTFNHHKFRYTEE